MKMFRMTLICLALIAGTSALSFAQGGRPERGHRDGDDKDNGRERDRRDDDRDGARDRNDDQYRNSAAYLDGIKFGRKDAEHHKNNHSQHKRWKSDYDVRAYEAGYERGYRDANGYRNVGYNNGYPNNNGGYNNGYPSNRNAGNPGFNMGYQDGTNDGRADRQANRPFKYGPGYNHPDRGYNNSLGDKNTYQQQYRIGYQQAYQQAYGRRG